MSAQAKSESLAPTANHTPGPWRCDPTDYGGRGGDWYVVVDAPDVAVTVVRVLCDDRPYKANARLIAAAPDMLEALRGVIEWWDADGPHRAEPDFVTEARAAIANAEGKTPVMPYIDERMDDCGQ